MRHEKRESLLVYYAASRLQGLRLPGFSSLPQDVQADILSIWPSYRLARAEGDQFLFSLGNAEQVQLAARNAPVGKIVGESLYVHRSAEDQLRPLSRLQIFAARQIVGEQEYELVKLSTDGRKVSFLRYPDFDRVAHPALVSSLLVYLPKADYSYQEFSSSDSPPILHRKELLVDETYPLYEKFASLTRQEEKYSLLSRPDIGHLKSWERILAEMAFHIRGHRLLRRK